MAHATPKGLGDSGSRLWLGIAGPDRYELRADELQVLEDACREADLVAVLDAGLEGQPLVVKGSQGQDVINPLISELRQHRATLSALLKALKLADVDVDPVAAKGARSSQAREAANARWARRGA